MKKIIIGLVLLAGLESNAYTECLTLPDDQATRESMYEAVASQYGWTEKIQQQVNGEYMHEENGDPLMIDNPIDAAEATRQQVKKFILDNVKAYNIKKAREQATVSAESALAGLEDSIQ